MLKSLKQKSLKRNLSKNMQRDYLNWSRKEKSVLQKIYSKLSVLRTPKEKTLRVKRMLLKIEH